MSGEAGEIKIRPMEQQDIDGIFQIDRKIGGMERAFTYEDMIDTFMGGEVGCSFVAEAGGEVIGFVLAAVNYVPEQITEVCTIQVVGVDPDYRRRGIARELIEALAENCRERGLKSIRVLVDERDPQLRELFEAMDFRRGRLIDYSRAP